MTARVLMILTSSARMGADGPATGLWAEEMAAPYYTLVDAGVEVSLASTAGGPVPVDPGSVRPRGENALVVERWLADRALQARLAATVPVGGLDVAGFDALLFPGGHGTVWDLPLDAGVKRAVEAAWQAGRLVAAVCHGVAALVAAQDPAGRPLVAGRRVNAFTDAEERAVGLDRVVPFLLEQRLRALGAHFESAAPWQPYAVRDGQLITGQNPQSSERVAAALLEALAPRLAPRPAAPISAIQWPAGYLPGLTDNFVSNEVIVAGLGAAQVWTALADTRAWPQYYPNASEIAFRDGGGPLLQAGSRFRFTTFGFPVEAQVTEFVPPASGVAGRVAWHGWVEGDTQHRLDVHHAWLVEELDGQRVRVLTQETQHGQPARELAATLPNAMLNAHQAWLEGLVRHARGV